MNMELWRLSACELSQGIKEKRFSSEEVTASVSARISEHNPRLNAIVEDYSEEALEGAREADRALAVSYTHLTLPTILLV